MPWPDSSPNADADAWRALHVLVVDDGDALRAVAVALLQQLGVGRVSQAADGREALALIEGEGASGTRRRDTKPPRPSSAARGSST